MSRRVVGIFTLLIGINTLGGIQADEVVLKDGSWVVGEVIKMDGGKLTVKTVFAKEIEIDWNQVSIITTDKPLPFILSDGTSLLGQAVKTPEGGIAIQTKDLASPVRVDTNLIVAINPPAKPSMTFKGFVSLGATINDGNTSNRSASATGEFIARSKRQRFTLRGIYNYSEDGNEVTARNARGTIKYDFFVTKRLYLFASALFENDKFQDLNLRTALSAGPGYQFIEVGQFEPEWLKELQLYAEVGISYFDEDFKNTEDQQYVSARWSVKIDWAIYPGRIVLFHYHEGYPSLERASDFYITTEQGVRLSIIKNFFAALQINYRYDNTPPPGRERSDTTYLISLGYNFDLTASGGD